MPRDNRLTREPGDVVASHGGRQRHATRLPVQECEGSELAVGQVEVWCSRGAACDVRDRKGRVSEEQDADQESGPPAEQARRR